MSRTDDELYNLSDEELLNMAPPSLDEGVSEEPAEETDEDDATSTDDAPAEEGAEGAEADAEEQGETDDGEPDEAKPVAEPAEAKEPAEPTEKVADQPVDYKAMYEQITAPFRANGKEMRITDPADIVALMQMGANYNKKMAALKPNLKVLKLLENNGLLSEERISFLIDLSRKDPAAVQKLVKDSGIDPLDMDVSKDSEYKPKTYTVDDRELELDAVLDEIQHTPTYAKVIDLVSTKWDGPSKQTIANSPQLLKVINDHMASGIYDLIVSEVERERMLGRLTGKSDIEAYRDVGDAIHARGGFNHLGSPQPRQAPAPTRSRADDAGRKDRKRAASPPAAAAAKVPEPDFNPLALSDAEFEKQMNARLL